MGERDVDGLGSGRAWDYDEVRGIKAMGVNFYRQLADGSIGEGIVAARLTNAVCWKYPQHGTGLEIVPGRIPLWSTIRKLIERNGSHYLLTIPCHKPLVICNGQSWDDVSSGKMTDFLVTYKCAECLFEGCASAQQSDDYYERHEVKTNKQTHMEKRTQNIFVEAIQNKDYCKAKKRPMNNPNGVGWYWNTSQPSWYHFYQPFEFSNS